MKISSLALGAGLALAAASFTPSLASAAFDGWTVRGTSQRAGPGEQYPRIGYVPGGVNVRIFGCVRGVRYCDVAWRGNRGWIRGSALAGLYRGRRVPLVGFYLRLGVPYLAFNFRYWDDHYRDRPFFRDRDKWSKDLGANGNTSERSDQALQSKFPPRKKIENDNEQMNSQAPDTGKPGEKPNRNRGCGPNSDNPNCPPPNQ